ncbi:MAG: type II secretion system GspH family protein [Phycisphaerales bacterium]|nr:type II secretion system GspH family protein [Phycisphaerales bacterium]
MTIDTGDATLHVVEGNPMDMHRRTPSRGFTLIEALVVVAILALLIVLAIPAISRVTRARNTAMNLSAMRGLGHAISLYSQDHDLNLPFYGTPGLPSEPARFPNATLGTAGGALIFRIHALHWSTGVTPYMSGSPVLPDDALPGGAIKDAEYPEGMVKWCRYWMTHTAFAAPEFFKTGELHTPTLVRGVRFNEFRHPARKVLLTDVGNSKGQFEPSHPGEGARVLFVDGSARTIPWTPRSFDPGIGFGFWVTTRLPGMATEGGSKGVDDFN